MKNHKMKNYKMKQERLLLLMFSVLTLLQACKSDSDAQPTIAYGPEVVIGKGSGRSLIQSDVSGKPIAIGLQFSPQALDGLPQDHHSGQGSETHQDFSYVLPLPKGKEKMPFDHISLDWSASGHQPSGVYDKPHFDIHFYKITQNERASIAPGPEMELLPDSLFLPPMYGSQPGEGVPQMGKHWVDFTSPELSEGKPFTTTFVYGSYNGKVIFYEPMLTRDFLLSQPDTIMPIKQAASVDPIGKFYPTSYSVRYDKHKGLYSILLEEMQLK